MKRALILYLVLLSLKAFSQDRIISLYLGPEGCDENSGFNLFQPLASIDKALLVAAQVKNDSPSTTEIDILLKGGTYRINKTIEITPQISGSGSCSIYIKPYLHDTVILDGSQMITGWKKYRNKLWVTTIPDVKEGRWKFRQFFVNGKTRSLAHLPDTGFYYVKGFPDGGAETDYHKASQRFNFRPGDINPNWKNLQDIRIVLYHFWTDTHLQIDSVDEKNNIVKFKYPAEKRFTDDFTSDGAKYIVENVFEGLNHKGEWYLDYKTGNLFYWPLEGENLNNLKTYAPRTPAFFRFTGDPAKSESVKNVHIENITFRYSNFMLAEGDQNDMQASMTIPGAFVFKGCLNCSIDHCNLLCLGSYAVEVGNGCSSLHFRHNFIHQVSAGGLKVDGGTEKQSPFLRTGNIEIADNTIAWYGVDFPSAVGILLMNAEACYIGHNSIHHGGYTGISLGWRWGYERSISWNNLVEYNDIHHIGITGLLSDMGGIYTLGVSPGTILRNNLIHDVDANHYGGWGIYNDEGSTHLLIENNIVYNTKYAAYNIHYARELSVRNNIFVASRKEVLNRGRAEAHTSLYFENNIIYWTNLKDPFTNNWSDFSYLFHANPNEKDFEKNTTFDADYNLYYNPEQVLGNIRFNGSSWTDWQIRGKDQHSLYADPQFEDPSHFDFRLKPGSPAFELGFKAIDMSQLGPRIEPEQNNDHP